MSEKLRAQIHNNLIVKNTEELLEIWQEGELSEWHEEVFELAKEILVERLGYLPSQSNEAQVHQIMRSIERHIDDNELDKALSECELAIQMKPNSAIAYNYRGEIYDQMGQLEDAIANYQRAIQFDPDLEEAWDNLLDVEAELEEKFEESIAKQHLDQALEYAHNDGPDKALEECEIAKLTMPRIAIAYNYLGLILQTLDQLEPAIESYLNAIRFNPRFYAARENLANARVRWEEEQYLRMSNLVSNENEEASEMKPEFDESLGTEIVQEGNPIPGWVYLDANAFLLRGWPGHRNRPGRSGYDPLERDFEFAHMQGVIFRKLITAKFRTRNPIYLIFMAYMGISYFLYGTLPFTLGNLRGILAGIIYIPYSIVGIALLINVYLSLRLEKTGEDEDNGYTFF